MNYLLDTNVISELVARQPNPRVIQWLDQIDPTRVYLSVITIGELRKGMEKLSVSKRRDSLRDWLQNDLLIRFQGHILILDIDVMLTWGEMAGRLEQAGKSLPAIDSLIAALALHHNCCLATRNEEDFKETGVTILNPWK